MGKLKGSENFPSKEFEMADNNRGNKSADHNPNRGVFGRPRGVREAFNFLKSSNRDAGEDGRLTGSVRDRFTLGVGAPGIAILTDVALGRTYASAAFCCSIISLSLSNSSSI